MVKPPRTMQPEGVDLKKAGRAPGRAFQEDSFRNYMARKIDLQRKQFGVLLPPPPPPVAAKDAKSDAREVAVSFAPDVLEKKQTTRSRRKRKKSSLTGVLRRLEKRHGRAHKLHSDHLEMTPLETDQSLPAKNAKDENLIHNPKCPPVQDIHSPSRGSSEEGMQSHMTGMASSKTPRPDLFMAGVVVIINGYTHPDSESLQRMLQQHGGDVERYETARITHIIAEHLSTAKAKIYAGQKKPTPVVHPKWIVDCITEERLLPHAPYLLPEVRDLQQQPSVATFFRRKALGADKETPTLEECAVTATKQSAKPHQSHIEQSVPAVPPVASTRKQSVVNPYRTHLSDKTSHLATGLASPHLSRVIEQSSLPTTVNRNASPGGRTDDKYINGQVRTVGTDPNFLETFFAESRLSFIGSFRQRVSGNSDTLRSRASTGRRPSERYVLHVDMDSFFAAVVLRNYPEYRDKPVAICHFGKSGPNGGEVAGKDSTSECATINYEARKFGLKKGMFLGRARSLCPSLVVLPYDFNGYEEVSEQVSEICHRYAGRHFGVVETVSCDESYMEVFVEDLDAVKKLADDIRDEIFESTKCTATVGVASNKLLAKLTTDKVKPNKSFVASGHIELMQNLRLRDLHGIGYRSEPRLAEKGFVNVRDVWDRGESAEYELQTILGKQLGTKIYGFCQGRDDRPVQTTERKTIGAECNYGVRFDGPYGVEYLIEGLCKEVQKRMEHVDVTGTKVTLKVKQRKEGAKPPPKFLGHGSCHNLSKSVDLSGPSRDWRAMARVCITMFEEMKVATDDVRGMGVIVSKLQGTSFQGGIQSFFQRKRNDEINTDGKESISQRQLSTAKRERPARGIDGSSEADGKRDIAAVREGGESNPFEETHMEQNSGEDDDLLSVEMMNLSQPSFASDSLGSSSRKNHGMLDSPFGNFLEEGVQTKLPFEDSENLTSFSPQRNPAPASSGTRESTSSVDNDFEIPSLSQIHMSQVDALPTPMRRKIHAKVEESRVTADYDTLPSPPNLSVPAPPPVYRQTDVKRMMRLAAVKAGQAESVSAANISLTQLDRLPVEVQLQVANDDDLALGKFSPRKTVPKKRNDSEATRRSRSVAGRVSAPRTASGHTVLEKTENKSGKADVRQEDPSPLATLEYDDVDFFQENILPLSKFLDETSITEESSGLLKMFFEEFIAAYSWYHVVLLMRSIRRRGDQWSAPSTFLPVFNIVNEKFREETGDDLCLLQFFDH